MYPWANTPVPERAVLDRLLSKVKANLIVHDKGAGFLGSLMCDHAYIWDETCDTAWCNGTTVAFNPKFFMWMTPASRLTVLIHELWHTGYDHMSRIGPGRCPDKWNEAADYVINNLLDIWKFDFSQLMEIKPCLDHQYDDMTTEEVYDLLVQQGGKPMPLPDPGNGPADPNAQGQSPSPGKPQNGTLSRDVRAPASQEAASDVKASIVKAMQVSKMRGEAGMIPGELELHIEQFLNPVLPWEILLARFYSELSQDDYSWKRPSRRHQDEYLPSPDGDNRLDHLAYYMDVSGSVTDAQVLRFFSEVKFIHEQYQPKKISMITFDKKIQDELEIEDGEPFEKIVIHGRGGTSLVPVYEHIKKTQPTAAVVFSDLRCPPMSRSPGPEILWVVIDNQRASTHFGKEVHIKE